MARKEKVTNVIDGDTFETSSRKNPVRLANVDAPEKGTPGGTAATRALKQLIEGETVSIPDRRARSLRPFCRQGEDRPQVRQRRNEE